MVPLRRLLLVAPSRSYRVDDFLAAAARLGPGVELLVATDRCHELAGLWKSARPEGEAGREARFSVVLDLRDAAVAAGQIAAFDASLRAAGEAPLAAILGTDDGAVVVAALAAQALGLPHLPPEAALAARDKERSRERLRAAGLSVPPFEVVGPLADPVPAGVRVGFPCVVKPLLLSASRGVLRADDPAALRLAAARVRRILAKEPPSELLASRRLLIERFIPGPEVALEGLMQGGRLSPLALFDKPDPLDGPCFEETLYVTPSRLPAAAQRAIAATVERAALALGLAEGPVHAELRLPESEGESRPTILEVAARSIGGLCSRTLRFGAGISLEELLLRHALGLGLPQTLRERSAAGVLMLPIPRAGTFHAVFGVAEARAVPGVEDVIVTVRPGERLVPLPEGNSYLGFAFARAATPAEVEWALREAWGRLRFDLGPALATVGP